MIVHIGKLFLPRYQKDRIEFFPELKKRVIILLRNNWEMWGGGSFSNYRGKKREII